MNENCGVCGVSCEKDSGLLLYKLLLQLQHRGQLSSGLTTFHPIEQERLRTHKGLGLVNNVFNSENREKFASLMNRHSSKIGIGHVRYATSGLNDISFAQPFERTHGKKDKWFSFCFNGNIANYEGLKLMLEASNYHIVRDTDTEILMHLIAKGIKDSDNLIDAFSCATSILDGSYNISFLNAEGALVAARDPLGFKPLCYSLGKDSVAFASESVALSSNGFENIIDLPPGHMLIHKNGETTIECFAKSKKRAHCFFEWVYFSHPASVIEGTLVYDVRHKLGKSLAKLETETIGADCIVVPVPDSSRPSGEGFAQALGMPCIEGLIRNRYVGRTFIESHDRSKKVHEKFTLIRQVIEGKRIFLVDDSIVRGSTMKNLVDYIKKYGRPKEIHVRVSCPPILWPCFYGIDMSSRSELIAAKYDDDANSVEQIKNEIGASSLIYQTTNGLVEAIGLEKSSLCLACINGNYPTKRGEELKSFSGNGRACEN
ncbi:MAG: amidophosphoribosyltransferase [archaeon]